MEKTDSGFTVYGLKASGSLGQCITPIMENQMEKQMDSETEVGVCGDVWGSK